MDKKFLADVAYTVHKHINRLRLKTGVDPIKVGIQKIHNDCYSVYYTENGVRNDLYVIGDNKIEYFGGLVDLKELKRYFESNTVPDISF